MIEIATGSAKKIGSIQHALESLILDKYKDRFPHFVHLMDSNWDRGRGLTTGWLIRSKPSNFSDMHFAVTYSPVRVKAAFYTVSDDENICYSSSLDFSQLNLLAINLKY